MRQGKDIINRYNTYLRLEKSLSANSIDAYLTDLDKLLRFAEDEKKDVKEISYDDLQQFIAQLRDIGHPSPIASTHHLGYQIVLSFLIA